MKLKIKNSIQLSENTLKKIKHPLRQKILILIDDSGVIAPKSLELSLKISSGKLHYHLNIINGLILQNDEKKYYLSTDGVYALNYIYSSFEENDLNSSISIKGNFELLANENRRKILLAIDNEGEFGIAFSELLKNLKLTTGTLYYHLKQLNNLINQKKDKVYIISKNGAEVINYLYNYIDMNSIPLSKLYSWKKSKNYDEIFKNVKVDLSNLESTFILIESYLDVQKIERADSIVTKLISEIKNGESLIPLHYYKAKILILYEDYKGAEEYLKMGIQINQKKKLRKKRYKQMISNLKLLLAEVFWRRHDLTKSLNELTNLLSEIDNKDFKLKGLVFDHLSTISWIQGDYDLSLQYLNSSLEFFRKFGDFNSVELSTTKLNLLKLTQNEKKQKTSEFTKKLKETLNEFQNSE